MKITITPLEIRQKTKAFKTEFRGYEKDEVQAFLDSLSQVWEGVLNENRELRIRLENSEKEVQKLREVEDSLFKTLKTAEDTSSAMLDQATKKASLQLREAELEAEALIKDAKWKAKTIVEDAADEAKRTYTDLQKELKGMEREYSQMQVERESLLAELRTIANDVIERVNRSASRSKARFEAPEFKQPAIEFVENEPTAKPQAQVQYEPVKEQPIVREQKPDRDMPHPEPTKVHADESIVRKERKDNTAESFFDQLD